ncbi:MAG: SUMF1/EgtB/PvdO family nonheme iron enzyme [Betaproteobacteria bacterium]|nr:SUMF1/EgtB/PvdO family nonheme iron enzyme [Betaproteobacteria bacterium]
MAVVRPTWSVLAGVVAAAPVAIASAATLDIAMVRVGNAGNGADPLTGLGAVPYEYYIGTTEVTNAQYAAFLNAVDPSGVNPHDLYNPNMTNATGFAVVKGGIDLVPEAVAGSKYAPKQNYANKPVNYVSFHDAARFANWLMTGDTESGFYVFSDTHTLVSQGVHGPETLNGMNWVAITSHDEWYKAAFHRNDGLSGNYYLYPTASDETPVVATATAVGDIANPGPNVANYAFGANWDGTGSLGHFTTVGSAGPESASPYGTFDQGGNVIEWIDEVTGIYRVTRGGSLWLEADKLRSDYSSFYNPNTQGSSLGFRISSLQPVSSVPVPPPLALMTVGLLSLRLRRRAGPVSPTAS